MTEPNREPAEWITRLKRQYGSGDDVRASAVRVADGTAEADRFGHAGFDDPDMPDEPDDEADSDVDSEPADDDDIYADELDEDGGPLDAVASDEVSGGAEPPSAPVDLDTSAYITGIGSPDTEEQGRTRRFNPWVAGGFAAAAAVATIVTLVIATATSRDPVPPPSPPSPVAKPAPPPPVSQTPRAVDGPLRFTATSSCDGLPGSTPAQLLADPNSDAPWVCATDTPGEYLTLVLDRPARITAVAITPGAVLKGNGVNQADPWPQYRVVKRVQWSFDDPAITVKSQDTGLTHGEVRMAMPSVLTSVVTVLVQETSRPPRVATPTTAPAKPANGDLVGSILGSGPGVPATNDEALLPDDNRADPSDGKFAISSIRLIGHEV
ncbi:Uncharacterised protein [Mycobacteroides abscessus subsp. massiliense]|uniref:hypothetical protein n=1 Tax=Mycobacteroides abscessus TaxID=36809 RepID=UPI0009A7183E|nr:hypothetical protein [Mycobacteroides abscessus]SKK91652.1 Uncharacterised protein [Mycobacteroides abscessus subsp. massiliense]